MRRPDECGAALSCPVLGALYLMRPRLLRSSCEGPAARLGCGATCAGMAAVVRAMPTTVPEAGPRESRSELRHTMGRRPLRGATTGRSTAPTTTAIERRPAAQLR